ncbi:hypothetical protein J2T02_000278 [Chitinophaga terrae (ex Kim and Jung 2007)]|uniref:TapB family protein n=1 Tax=Chitinophaga terrae (ex Kim and Jung 2007) TaxID=408074 RepID=UPI00277F2015|nr:hypothetical protein [Chitinophaga terrae (ex Kim and Jung 2007)]MDQ0105195.1 hypothetical protein [Chitinophaga terrae (ex Kim and Jung 2007)]
MTRSNSYPSLFRSATLIVALAGLLTACKKDKNKTDDPGGGNNKEESYIPENNKKYVYELTGGDETMNMTTWVAGSKDSAGLKVYYVATKAVSEDIEVTSNSSTFVTNGKTVYGMNIPEFWYKAIADLIANGYTVEESTMIGYPAYRLYENPMEVGRKLTFQGEAEQGLRLKLKTEDGQTLELTQTVKYYGGEVKAVEDITVPAGKFKCTKFVNEYDTRIVLKLGQTVMTDETHRTQETTYMAHKIGPVKTVSVSEGETTTTQLKAIQ